MRVIVIEGQGSRAHKVTRALLEGIPKTGDEVQHVRAEFCSGVRDDVDGAVHYGLRGKTFDAFKAYRKQKFSVYIDMGYWGRREGGSHNGFHKVSISNRHPTAYFQRIQHPPDRFRHFNIEIEPWKKDGKHILLAGMGDKAAFVEGFRTSEWERAAIAEIRRYTDRPIIYRPKPSWRTPESIPGAEMVLADNQKLDDALRDCWCVVTHHSNLAVDALVKGIPVFTSPTRSSIWMCSTVFRGVICTASAGWKTMKSVLWAPNGTIWLARPKRRLIHTLCISHLEALGWRAITMWNTLTNGAKRGTDGRDEKAVCEIGCQMPPLWVV